MAKMMTGYIKKAELRQMQKSEKVEQIQILTSKDRIFLGVVMVISLLNILMIILK